jgi:prepilin-type N-terminal cleavage/methylation domain-containing protein
MIRLTLKDRRGVTLIEVLIVLLIVSILAAIVQPKLTSDSVLGRTALELLASPKWNAGDKYTWVIE